ncbi:MAG: class I SAM-dependent methyltransferase [Acidimicrobiia bacterium]|nr:class I SAM-dependent methyltransferase [Acidimicrobiia bacterium]
MNRIPHARRALLRTGEFHALLGRLWTETRPGVGRVSAAALDALPGLWHWLASDDTPDRHRAAFLLGLLADAEEGESLAEIHTGIASRLDVACRVLSKSETQPESTEAMRTSLLFLLSHHHAHASWILPHLDASLGPTHAGAKIVRAVFRLATDRPLHSRFLRLSLGAEACAASGGDLLGLAKRALACPLCHAPLTFADDANTCTQCDVSYGWVGESPDLVPPDCTDKDDYPTEIVHLYESEIRPRFVRVMAHDWNDDITAERERLYVATHLTPVEGPILDLACGAGSRTRHVAALVGHHRVIALDFSSAMLAACRVAVPGVLTVRGSADALPFGAGQLGAVNCSDALQALPSPERALAEVGRCLAPGGVFTAFTFAEASTPYRYFQHRFPAIPRRLFTRTGLTDALHHAGLDPLDVSTPHRALFLAARKPLAPSDTATR